MHPVECRLIVFVLSDLVSFLVKHHSKLQPLLIRSRGISRERVPCTLFHNNIQAYWLKIFQKQGRVSKSLETKGSILGTDVFRVGLEQKM